MATNIFLGYPPETIKQFIINNYSKPVDMTKVPLHFTANNPGEGATVSLICFGYDESNDWEGGGIDSWCELQYSTDRMKTWNDYTTGQVINLDNCENQTVYMQAKQGNVEGNPNLGGFAIDDMLMYHYFDMKGSIKADGNIQFLLENTGTKMNVPNYCYSGMFMHCKSLTKAPILPATTLAEDCYYSMFSWCTSLTQAPELPATTLSTCCYYYMFSGCTSLTQAPILPATENFASECYSEMFYDCTNIPEPKYIMPNLTFEQVANAIQNNYILGSWWGITFKIQCSDKILVATYDGEA